MGASTNAVVFFGHCWQDEARLLDGDDEWDKAVFLKRGGCNPWDAYPEAEVRAMPYARQEAFADAWRAEHKAELDAYYAARKAIREEFGCDIGYHCSNECAMPYVYATGGEILARRGCPVDLGDKVLLDARSRQVREEEWHDKIDRFLAELGIARPEGQDGPRWWLVSSWG